jgi:N-acylneuraminate cytidylyltransferase
MPTAADAPICVIPARGGSKRFPRKNLAHFRGRSLLALTVDTARESGVYARIIVSTDDEEIAREARGAGADVRERPAHLSGDFITLEPVLLDAADWIEGGGSGQPPAIGSVMLTTSPLRTAADVRGAYDKFAGSGADFLMVVSRYLKSPFLALEEREGFARLMFPELARQQPAPPVWVDTGMAYFARLDALRAERTFYGRRMTTYEVPVERAIDVDEPYHLRFAELIDGATRRA